LPIHTVETKKSFKFLFVLALALAVIAGAIGPVKQAAALNTTYHVGPGQTYTTLGAVPWSSLGAGDKVYIHWKSTPYNEIVLISGRGTSSAPIEVRGVSDGPNGEKPVIDANGASYTANSDFLFPSYARGPINIQRPASQPETYRPGYIVVDNLELRGGFYNNPYYTPTGGTRSFAKSSAGVYVLAGEHITISNNTITFNGNGIFVSPEIVEQSSGPDTIYTARDITIEHNDIYGNGISGSYNEHNVYVESAGHLFQYNKLGQLRSGAQGSLFKDRSSGTVVRYNYMRGGARWLDLVDAEATEYILPNEPDYDKAYVYGNVMIARQGDTQFPGGGIHWGGDRGDLSTAHNGTLYFYNNTLSFVGDAASGGVWNANLFDIQDIAGETETVDARNNIIHVTSTSPGTITPLQLAILRDGRGDVNFGVNYMSPGWVTNRSGTTLTGTITGTGSFITPSGNSVGFANLAANDLHLASGSPAINAGAAQSSGVPSGYLPVEQYLDPASREARAVNGTLDLGAFEYDGTTPPPDTTAPSVPSGLTATAVSSSSVSLSWTASTDNVGGTGVSGYRVYRNGSLVGTTALTSYSDTGLVASTLYAYEVAAYDGASNVSANSSTATATTLSGGGGGGSLPIYLYDEGTSLTLSGSGGGSAAQIVIGGGDGGTNGIEFYNLDSWDRTREIDFTTSIDISAVAATDSFSFSIDLGNVSQTSQFRLVFNGYSWSGAPYVQFQPDMTAGYETMTIPLTSTLRTALGNQITKIYIERLSNEWPAGSTTMRLDEVRFH